MSEHGNVQLETKKIFEAKFFLNFETDNITYGTVKRKKIESENQKNWLFFSIKT